MLISNQHISTSLYFWNFIISFSLSLILCKGIILGFEKYSFIRRFIDRLPSHHEDGVMSFGGIGVILSFFLTLWGFYLFNNLSTSYLTLLSTLTISVGLMFTLGIFDDVFDFTARIKFPVQIVIVVILFFSGIKIHKVGDLVFSDSLSFFITAIWVIGISNAINLIDGQDGLAGGVVFLSCLTLFFIYLGRNLFDTSLLSITLGGSILGFFTFNFPPAKIILGDTGSLPTGLVISIITLLPVSQGFNDEIYYLIPVIALLYPIMDTSNSFFRRIIRGKNPFQKDEEHFHHRLIRLGFSPLKTISLLFGICFYFNLVSLIPIYFINLIPRFLPIFFVFIILNIISLMLLLIHIEKKYQRLHESASRDIN